MHPICLLLLMLPQTLPASVSQTWAELKAKRESLTLFHQEFERSRSFKNQQIDQSSILPVVLDVSKDRWREVLLSGSGRQTRIFDGKNLFVTEDGGNAYAPVKLSSKEEPPQPNPYGGEDFDWPNAVEAGRATCLSKLKHQCVTLDIPIEHSIRIAAAGQSQHATVLSGSERVTFDTETGLILSSRLTEVIDDGRHVYLSETIYKLQRLSYGGTADPAIFQLPATATREVKELPDWNAAGMKKQFAGKPAADLALKDLQGKLIHVGDLKGKTVLLDFWATWCGPCRADGPALDKLYQKYGASSLVIIGISVDEERATVEKFLSQHPHQFSIALTAENEIPTAYRVGVYPTYMVIDTNGNFAAATEGDKGFADLRKLLKKAGLDTD